LAGNLYPLTKKRSEAQLFLRPKPPQLPTFGGFAFSTLRLFAAHIPYILQALSKRNANLLWFI
jgi:hypothetical protein